MRSIRLDVEPPIRSPSATGSTGCRAPERAKKSSIQPTASAVRAVTSGVALANRPKAIPEFWTWWIENGPSTCSDSSSASWLETIHLVSWSAAIAARTTAPSPTHCEALAASERSADDSGVSASVLEPTRTSTARGAGSLIGRPFGLGTGGGGLRGNREGPPVLWRRGLVGETWFPPRERAAGERRSPALLSALAVDALRRVEHRLEPLAGGGDRRGTRVN